MSATNLSRYLVTPSRVASLMDWKSTLGTGAVMALDITRDRIGVAVASHPNSGAQTKKLDPIHLPRGRAGHRRSASTSTASTIKNDNIASQLQEIVSEERVCAFVVRWPLQDGGRMGAKCGKVLHALDSLVAEENKKAVIGKNRPFALWDDRALTGQSCGTSAGTDIPDEWGRLASFGRVPDTDRMFYSSRQPRTAQAPHENNQAEDTPSSEMAAKVLKNFLDGHFMDSDNDFLGLNSSPPRSKHTRASAVAKSGSITSRRNLIPSNKKRETIVAQAARDSIDEEGKQAYISQSLL